MGAREPLRALLALSIATVLALAAGCRDTTLPGGAARIRIEGLPATPLAVGDTVQLSAAVLDADGAAVAGRMLTWQSSDTAVASVAAGGRVIARAAGSATIRAQARGALEQVVVTVRPPLKLVATPDTLVLHLLRGSADSLADSLTITHTEPGRVSGLATAVRYAAGVPSGWLSARLGAASAPTRLHLEAAGASLPVGRFGATVVVANAIGDSVAIPVTLVVHTGFLRWAVQVEAREDRALHDVWVSADGAAHVAAGSHLGGKGQTYTPGSVGIVRYDAGRWSTELSLTAPNWQAEIRAISAAGSTAFAVGREGVAARLTSSGWMQSYVGEHVTLNGVWSTPSGGAFAVGDGGFIARFDGTSWNVVQGRVYPSPSFHDVHGNSEREAVAVGTGGSIWRFDGEAWRAVTSPTQRTLRGVHVRSATEAYAVGDTGTVLRFDGSTWSTLQSGVSADLWRVRPGPGGDLYAIGDAGVMLRLNGTTISRVESGTKADLRGLSANGAHAYAVGTHGTVIRYDGTRWREVESAPTLNGVWGSGSRNVFAVGESGTILRYDGSRWAAMESGTAEDLWGVWGSSADRVFAVGARGTVLRYDGTRWHPEESGVTVDLRTVGGSGGAVYAGGSGGSVLQRGATGWRVLRAPYAQQRSWAQMAHYTGTWVSPGGDPYFVGIFHTHSGPLYPIFSVSVTAVRGGAFTDTEVTSARSPRLGIWGSSDQDIFISAPPDRIHRFDGVKWTSMSVLGETRALWGTSSGIVYGAGGEIVYFDGRWWSMGNPARRPLNAVWGPSGSEVFAVGEGGAIVRGVP